MVKRRVGTPTKSSISADENLGSPEQSPRDRCPICMDTISSAGVVGCGHEFCFDCIHRWASTENSCPLCKKRFRTINRKDLNTSSGKKSKSRGGTKVNVKHRNQSHQPNAVGIGGIGFLPFNDIHVMRMMLLRNMIEDNDPFENAFYMPPFPMHQQLRAPSHSIRINNLLRMGGDGVRRALPNPSEIIVLDDDEPRDRQGEFLY